MPLEFLVIFLAAMWAGGQNAIAGGGSFLTLPALIFSGLDPRLANITSTVALFPGQVASGWSGRRAVDGTGQLSFKTIAAISLVGGAAGAPTLASSRRGSRRSRPALGRPNRSSSSCSKAWLAKTSTSSALTTT